MLLKVYKDDIEFKTEQTENTPERRTKIYSAKKKKLEENSDSVLNKMMTPARIIPKTQFLSSLYGALPIN